MKYVDDKNKNLKWWNRNYFWLGTILYVFINLMLYMSLRDLVSTSGWSVSAEFFQRCIDVHIHSSWEHVLHNMLGYSICAFYIERKMGTLQFIGLNIFVTLVASAGYTGCSFIWFFMLGYVVIDYLFSFKKSQRNSSNIITGAIVIALEYFRCCFYDGPNGIALTYTPVQLLDNNAHFGGFMVGAGSAFVVHIALITCLANYELKHIAQERIRKAYFFVYPLVACLIILSFLVTLHSARIVNERTQLTIKIICSDSTYNATLIHDVTSKKLSSTIYEEWIDKYFYIENLDERHNFYTSTKVSVDSSFTKTYSFYNLPDFDYAYDREEFIAFAYPTTITLYIQLP